MSSICMVRADVLNGSVPSDDRSRSPLHMVNDDLKGTGVRIDGSRCKYALSDDTEQDSLRVIRLYPGPTTSVVTLK